MRIDVSARAINFPSICPCCGAPADTEVELSETKTTGKRVIKSTTKGWHIPYCSRCVEHARLWDNSEPGCLLALGLIGSFVAFFFAWPIGVALLLFSVVVVGIVSSRRKAEAKAACSPECAGPEHAAEYLDWNGSIHSFEFRSREYAAAFMLANRQKLVNLRLEATALLSEISERRTLPGIPQQRLLAANESNDADEKGDAELLKWVSKIEGMKGPASRRTALDAGLRALKTEEARNRLLVEASKIETQAALDKADSLKMKQAKRRTLQAALDAIRSDPVPDELQEEQIRWLEEALSELDDDAAA